MSQKPTDSLRPDRDLTILIPARAGSKRVPGKNTRLLGGTPLIQWTIEAAWDVNPWQVVVSTDDPTAGVLARELGCAVHFRKPEHATDDAPDFLWVNDLSPGLDTPYFAICRPTSPFRTAAVIRRGYATLLGSSADSIRGLTKITAPHPAKMWTIQGKWIQPVMKGKHPDGTPYHSSPTQTLPEVYVQNAALEIARTAVIRRGSISGEFIAPFLMDPIEGFDVNTEEDFARAEVIARERLKS